MTTERTTVAQLEAVCEMINRKAGLPTTAYTISNDGTYTPNAGVYHLSGQYGGYSLDRMCNEGTGVTSIFGTTTKRQLMGQMRAYLAGMEAAAA